MTMALTITINGEFHLSGNPIFVTLSGGSAPVGSSDYKLLLKIESADGDLIGAPFVDAIAPDGDGEALFDISGYCNQPSLRVFEWPLSGGLNPYGEMLFEIKLTPGEIYIDSNGNLQESWGSQSQSYFVINGKLEESVLAQYNAANTTFYDQYVVPVKFLTLQPDFQVVSPFQPVKYWVLAPAQETIEYRTKAYYDDGSTHEDSKPGHTLYKFIIHEINAYPPHNQSENMPMIKSNGAKMTHYESWIVGKTDKRTCIVDHRAYDQNSYLFIVNRLGGIDVLWLNGIAEMGHKTDQVKARKPLLKGASRFDRSVVTSKNTRRYWRLNSGHKSKLEMSSMIELLQSEQVWLLWGGHPLSSARLYPVIVENAEDILTSSSADLDNVEVELLEAY